MHMLGNICDFKGKLKDMTFSSSSSSSLIVVFVVIFVCFAASGKCSETESPHFGLLKNHSEIHRAKEIIDGLSFKLRKHVDELLSNYTALKKESLEYLTRSNALQSELDQLKQLRNLLNKLSGKSSTCHNIYFDYGFTASRSIIIKTSSSRLPKHYTVKVQVNHRQLIDSGTALNNGNDLRVFYQKSGDSKAVEIDRILEDMGTTKATILFKLQEEIGKNAVETSTYFFAYGNKIASEAKQNIENMNANKSVSTKPTLSLGKECSVDLASLHDIGKSKEIPATSCKQIHDISFHNGQHRLTNGVYWIQTSVNHSVLTYCDLENGGWTLVGKISGRVRNIYKTWLITNHDVSGLSNPVLSSTSSARMNCLDARYLATNHASRVMFASGENAEGIGGKWVQWPLPAGRESTTLWTHAIGYANVVSATMEPVSVQVWNGEAKSCYQNKFGIMPLQQHGGSYPSVSFNTAGNTNVNDYCMSIGVLYEKSADGWNQNWNGYDSPISNRDWPNKQYNHREPYVNVWLK